MSLFTEKLADLEAKHELQIAGLMAAHGLIEEAEALCAAIATHMPMPETTSPQPLVTVHDDGQVAVRIGRQMAAPGSCASSARRR